MCNNTEEQFFESSNRTKSILSGYLPDNTFITAYKSKSVYCFSFIYHDLEIEDFYVLCNFISVDLVVGKVKDLTDREEVTKAIRTAVMSKQHGNEDFLGQLIADACSK